MVMPRSASVTIQIHRPAWSCTPTEQSGGCALCWPADPHGRAVPQSRWTCLSKKESGDWPPPGSHPGRRGWQRFARGRTWLNGACFISFHGVKWGLTSLLFLQFQEHGTDDFTKILAVHAIGEEVRNDLLDLGVGHVDHAERLQARNQGA